MNMKYKYIGFIVMTALVMGCNPSSKEKVVDPKTTITPPSAEKVPHELVANGNKRIDNYYWMKLSEAQRDASEKDPQTTKVLKYLNEENDYLNTNLKHTEALQEDIYKEITGRIKQTDESVPYKDNGYWYYIRYEQGQEYPVYCRKKGTMSAKEEILLNVNELAKGHSYYDIEGLSVSEDNNLL